MVLTVIVSRCAVAKLPKHVPNSAGVYWSLDASDADGLPHRGFGATSARCHGAA